MAILRDYPEPKAVPGAKWVSLGRGKFALVDVEDYEKVRHHYWRSDDGYAIRRERLPDGRMTKIYMHRVVTNASANVEIDHKNLKRWDNRKSNLRVATSLQNLLNAGPRNGKKYKGVYLNNNRWRARITWEGLVRNLGYFDTEEDAAHAYDAMAKKLHGEFAHLNFSERQGGR